MDKEFLMTIKEFGALTHTNPKSIRYYESIGILKPAWVDPENGYRYYSFYQREQVFAIQIAIENGLPLKEFLNYESESNGIIYYNDLVLKLIDITEEKIRLLQSLLSSQKDGLRNHAHARQILESPSPIRDTLSAKTCLRLPFDGKQYTDGWMAKIRELTKLFDRLGLLPCESGLMVCRENGKWNEYLFMEFISDDATLQEHPNFFTIPEGEYLCAAVPESGLEQAKTRAKDIPSPTLLLETELASGEYQYFPPQLEQRVLLSTADQQDM